MKKQEASYTAELSLILPVILLALYLPAHLGYELYGQAQKASEFCWDEEFCPEEIARKIKFAGGEILK